MAAIIQTIQKPTRARALDTSGNNNHGQIYSGRALEFDGVNDCFQHNGGTDISGVNSFADGEEWTFATWIYFRDTKFTLFVGDDDSTHTHIGLHNNDYIMFRADSGDYYKFDTTQTDTSTGSNPLHIDTWYRLVITAKDNILTCYLNGVQHGSTITTSTNNTSNGTAFPGSASDFTGWGMSYGSPRNHGLDGMMSDGQVWNSAWTADDALYDYNNPELLALNRGGTLLTNSNLKIWYPMNDGHRGQQSYILDASNTGLSDSILSNGDFSNGTTGWTFADCSGTVGTYFGESNVCKIEVTSKDTVGMYQSNFTTIGQSYKYSFDYYIPSTNTNLDAIQLRASSSSSNKIINSQTVADTWTSVYAYYTPASSSVDDVWVYLNSTSTGGNDLTVGNSVYVKNIKIEPVNGKNHATTVFKGDELITVAEDKNMDASNNWDVSSANWSIDGNSLDYDGSGGGNTALDQTYPAFEVGRTYEMKFNTSANDTIITIKDGDGTNTLVAETTYTSGTKTATFVAPATTDGLMLTAGGSSAAFAIDWINVKELGTASGWTDADQQLDIPQTALQSYNQLAWFSGINDSHLTHVQLSGDITKNVHNSNVSYSAWVKRNVTNAQHIIFGDDGTSVQKLIRLEVDGTISIESNNNDNTVIATLVANDTDWHHYVVTCASGTTKFYQDGHLLTNTNANVMDDALTIRRLGGGTGKGLEGSMTEASIWDAALTQAEVNELYNDGKALDALTHSNSNLFGYWRNNGLATWKDLKGSKDGTPTNFAEIMLITAGADTTRDSQGFLMNSQRLTNSLNYYPDVGGGSNLNIGAQTKVSGSPLTEAQLEAMTVTLWLKSPDNTQTDSLVNVVIDSAAEFIVQVASNGRFRWTYEINGFSGSARHQTNSSVFSTDKWTFVAFALDHDADTDANRVLCYAGDEDNAVSLQTNAGTQTGTPTSGMEDDSMWIGGEKASGRKFVGEIDDICVYSKTLTLAEITRNFNAGKRSHR